MRVKFKRLRPDWQVAEPEAGTFLQADQETIFYASYERPFLQV